MKTNSKSRVPKYVSNFPFKPSEKKPARITRDQSAQNLYGFEGRWNECYTFISTDKITLGIYYLPLGGYVDPPGHHRHGDELYYILEGEALVVNPETGQTLHLDAGDSVYIPQSTRHQIFNLAGQMLAVLSVLAPIAWKDDGMGTMILPVKDPKFFVPGVDAERSKFDEDSF
jgi:mannose-6-phosphate isomerase-like protein (cupin superfamily)